MKHIISYLAIFIGFSTYGQIKEKTYAKIEPKVIEGRHDIHQYPELSNREFRTAEKVAKHLKFLGMEVKTGVAHTGVV